ncbi:hypothetical protein RhiirA4_482482 [Rhizophagus irregularis]|uniref:Uncharacterized protein n=1 Tax=Rhizophagus irregularis TaxID=588596 RepID=A0A2I1HL57_9GLOM|nr:hypothetical protein RhiirA4_482482 [Rhizophagus irregularis]
MGGVTNRDQAIQKCLDINISNANAAVTVVCKDKDLEIDGTKIEKMNHEEGNRYLGIWFRYDNRRKNFKKKIKTIIDKASIVLSKEECEFLMQRINCLVKRCANLSRSTPNFIIYEKEIYGLKTIYDLQLESISKNIIYQANGNEN